MTIRAVWFDIGETLIDETREYGVWADWLGVPRHTFSAVFGAVVARGGDFTGGLGHFMPGFDLAGERRKRIASGLGECLAAEDLYPDARPCLSNLKEAGYYIGIAGNQTVHAGELVRKLGLPADAIGMSEEWGVAKPSPAFFDRIIEESRLSPEEIAYVGDRLDNDIHPAMKMGLRAIWIRRGPWGRITHCARVPMVLDNLTDLQRHLVRQSPFGV